ncbi:MAG: carboxypeptidase regulatory-like domain-containing protein [Thermoflexales bacterium]|nr:carboxypeptidase regulatory-like domain-containing protein [Thermoflexales bacterium]
MLIHTRRWQNLMLMVALILSVAGPVSGQFPTARLVSAQSIEQITPRVDQPPAPSNGAPVTGFEVRGRVIGGQAGWRVQAAANGGPVVIDEVYLDEAGRFEFRSLPIGHYRLRVLDGDGNVLPLADESRAEVMPRSDSDRVMVQLVLKDTAQIQIIEIPSVRESIPQITQPGLPKQPQANGFITGTITAADTGLPLNNVRVDVFNLSGVFQAYVFGISGVYSLSVPAGNYKVSFTSYATEDYAPEWYNNQRSFATASTVTVADGAVTANVDGIMDIGGKITGQVTAVSGGAPIAGVYVYAYTSTTSTSSVAANPTIASGQYTITGLTTGNYYVRFSPPYASPYLEEYYNDRRIRADSDVVPVTLGSVTGNINAALETGGSITGQVTAATGGAPLSDLNVYVYTSTTSVNSTASATTDAAGVYTVTRLDTGTYYVRFLPAYNSVYFEEYYNNQRNLAVADPVNVALNTVTGNIDAALETGGIITGQVTAAIGGAPLANAYVYVYTSTTASSIVASTPTDAAGLYTVTRLVSGNYYLRFVPPYPSDYLEEYYNNQRSLAAANPLGVTLGNVTGNINAALETGGKITGQVTATSGGAPIADITVYAYTSTTATVYAGYATTNASGVYTINQLLTGNYYVGFYAGGSPNYFTEYYNNQTSLAAANPVSINLNATTANINAALDSGGQITGQITAASGGAPIASVGVYVYTSTTAATYAGYATTNAAGVYTISRLLTGNYYLYFSPPYNSNYLSEYYNNQGELASANPVAVTKGGVTGGINAALDTGGQITGRVTAVTGGGPIANAEVYVYTSTTSTSLYRSATTDATGTYTVGALLTGNYYVWFYPPYNSNYLNEYYNDKATLAQANPVAVTVGAVTPNIDAALTTGGQITGMVTATNGTPISGVSVYAYGPDCNLLLAQSATTNGSGQYTIKKLKTGSYKLAFWAGSYSPYLSEYYNDKATLDTADAVNVAVGSTTGNINASLQLGGVITGQLTAADGGAPLPEVYVNVYNASNQRVGSGYTDANGLYSTSGLTTGNYRLGFDPDEYGDSASYLDEYYSDQATLAAASPVSVTLGGTTANINAVLARGAQITGRVAAEDTGAGLAGVEIYVSKVGFSGYAYTDQSGYFTTTGLISGSYKIQFDTTYTSGTGRAYISEYYNNKSTYATADPVNVPASGVVPNINAVLTRGGQISGKITESGSGSPIAFADVEIYTSGGSYFGYTSANSAGNYTTNGLPAGTYRLEFYYSGSYSTIVNCQTVTRTFGSVFYNQKPTLALADDVIVTVANTTGNINGALTSQTSGGGYKVFLPAVRR